MKKDNDMRAEYDFAAMKGGVRGKYASRYRAGTNLALLDPELARAFPTDHAVNQALRAVLDLTVAVRPPKNGIEGKGSVRAGRKASAKPRAARG
jgi:hypothetical protein